MIPFEQSSETLNDVEAAWKLAFDNWLPIVVTLTAGFIVTPVGGDKWALYKSLNQPIRSNPLIHYGTNQMTVFVWVSKWKIHSTDLSKNADSFSYR